DGVPRTLIEITDEFPDGIQQIVIPLKTSQGETIGAVIMEYTVLYKEIVGFAEHTIQIVVIASISCLLLAILLGYLISRTIANPIKQLTSAMSQITADNLDRA